ncbi:hypothetical protein Y1Q_0010351 [Alligator mississippiensis]|uniref:Uncharacterized protein n=1 Tax=Alligator mississippiensis TaxID=8496 RepID=A0A151NM64_ALLMI|nr:hypothetical protein Y1Q_0010351 [Alligator mississippiensis]
MRQGEDVEGQMATDQQATKYIPEAMGKNMAAEVQVGFARLVLVGHKRLIPNQGVRQWPIAAINGKPGASLRGHG